VKIALAQIDPTVGDFTGNLQKIVSFSRRAADLGARLTVFSELAICGYPPADLLEKPSFLARCQTAVDELRAATFDLPTAILAGVALPAGGAFIVLPRSAIRGVPPVNLMLLTGPSIDMTRLNAAVQATMPGAGTATVSTRSLALQGLTGAPLQQGTFLLFTLAITYAAALALAVMLLELALGAADRELTTARLAAMGLTERQRVRLVAVEVLPSIAASAAAAAACAIALPRLVAPVINLSVFTHSQAPVPLRPDFASFILPLAVLLAITIIALAYEIRSGRGRGVAGTMRT